MSIHKNASTHAQPKRFSSCRIKKSHVSTRSIFKHKQALSIAFRAEFMAQFMQNDAKFDDALRNFHAALVLFTKILGRNHPNVAHTYVNMGLVHEQLGNYEAAEVSYQNGIKIISWFKDKHELDCAKMYENLASVQVKKGSFI